MNQHANALKNEYGVLEAQLAVSLTESSSHSASQALSIESAAELLTLLLTLPHGVIKYSHTVPGQLPYLNTAAYIQKFCQASYCCASSGNRLSMTS